MRPHHHFFNESILFVFMVPVLLYRDDVINELRIQRTVFTMHEELTITVILNEIFEVKGTKEIARMINFSGYCKCDNFQGEILPGAVDTQREDLSGNVKLSARYMIKGVDKENNKSTIFIENNGEGDLSNSFTTPLIITDSPCLKYLENASLKGTIEPWEKGVIIHIFS